MAVWHFFHTWSPFFCVLMCFVLFLDFLRVVVIICGHHFWWSSFGGHYPNLLSPTTSCFGWWPWSFFAQMGKPMVIKVSKTLVKWWPYDDHVVIIWKWWPWAFWWSSYGHHMMTMVIILKWWPPWGLWSSFWDNAHQNAHHIPFGQVWSLLIFFPQLGIFQMHMLIRVWKIAQNIAKHWRNWPNTQHGFPYLHQSPRQRKRWKSKKEPTLFLLSWGSGKPTGQLQFIGPVLLENQITADSFLSSKTSCKQSTTIHLKFGGFLWSKWINVKHWGLEGCFCVVHGKRGLFQQKVVMANELTISRNISHPASRMSIFREQEVQCLYP